MTAERLSHDPAEALASLLDAGEFGVDCTAWSNFRALLNRPVFPPSLTAVIENAWRPFAGDDGSGLRQAIVDARRDEDAATRLLARLLFGMGREAVALGLARRLFERAPGPEDSFLLCGMLLKCGDVGAHGMLAHCLARFPEPSRGWNDLGQVLLGLGKKEAALVCFARGERSFANAIRRGLLARDLGRLAEARDAFAEATAFDERSPRAWFLLGTCAQDSRDFSVAAAAYERVLAIDPAVAEAAVNLGIVRQEAGDLEGAMASYRQAVQTRADTFGRVAQALSTASRGELWLDLGQLRRTLSG